MSPPSTSAPSPDPSPVSRRMVAHRRRNLAIFLAALAAVHAVAETFLPLPDVGEVSEKLAYFARRKDEFDAVFVGSSRVCRQIAPGVFDQQVTAATGRTIRSFNLGAPSMFLPESFYVIDRILAQRPTRLRWMFIELDDPKLRLEEHAGLVRREVYWHGPRETALMSADILAARGIRAVDRAAMLAHQWMLFGRRWTHLGQGQEWLSGGSLAAGPAADTDEKETGESAALGPAMDGYLPYGRTLGQGKGGAVDVRTFETAATALRAGGARSNSPPAAPALLRWLLAEKIRALRLRGIEPLFVVPPVTTGEQEFRRLPEQGVVRTLFAFNDPAAYPELYEVNARADTMHLNEKGALLFTRLLAERFAAYQTGARPGSAAPR